VLVNEQRVEGGVSYQCGISMFVSRSVSYLSTLDISKAPLQETSEIFSEIFLDKTIRWQSREREEGELGCLGPQEKLHF
jgi:hypothetical protein